MKRIVIKDPSQLIPIIKQHIDNSTPLLMIVKYSSLFYYFRYMDSSYFARHGLVISGYDSERSLILIRDNGHVQTFFKELVNGTGLFDLQLTDSMILDIWNRNLEIQEDSRLFCIERISDSLITDYNSLFIEALDIIKNNNNTLFYLINNFNNIKENLNNDNNIWQLRMVYVRSLDILFDMFDKLFNSITLTTKKLEEYEDFKNVYTKFRNKIITLLCTRIIRNMILRDDIKCKITNEITYMDEKLVIILQDLYKEKENIKNLLTHVHIDLKQYFNNQAFGDSLSMNCKANLRGSGSYILTKDLPQKKIWYVDGQEFDLSYVNGKENDNMLSNGQVIRLPCDKYYSISLLGCGVYNIPGGGPSYFKGKMIIKYSNNEKEEIEIGFSAIEKPPHYNEVVIWKSRCFAKKTDTVNTIDLEVRLFAKTYRFKHNNTSISDIQLPKCPYMHIFAITLNKLPDLI